MKTITLNDFNQYPDLIIYMDENIAILNGINKIVQNNQNITRLDCMMIIFCEEGEVTISVNGLQHLLQKGYCSILPPRTILQSYTCDTALSIKIVAVSQDFLKDTLGMNKATWDILAFLYNNPIFPINRTASYKMYLYKELLLTLIQEKTHVYSKRTRQFHLAGMFCEMFAMLNQLVPDYYRKGVNHSRSTHIVRDFIDLVNADDGTHRSVGYYADKLCYSPKHLCAIIKQTTGKTPIQIIQENAIEQIKYKLKHSEMSIKEIAAAFDFPNPSFFGKFVKSHTGMTPMEYRIWEEKNMP